MALVGTAAHCTLYVSHLPISDDPSKAGLLEELFGRHLVASVRALPHKTYGLVTFHSRGAAEASLATLAHSGAPAYFPRMQAALVR
jgi:hypothetical protein